MSAVNVFGSPIDKKKYKKFATGVLTGAQIGTMTPPLTVRGLKFRPVLVILYQESGGNWYSNLAMRLDTGYNIMENGYPTGTGFHGYKGQGGTPVEIMGSGGAMYNDGFYIVSNTETTANYRWWAFGW